MVHGLWKPSWASQHINVLELKAIHLALDIPTLQCGSGPSHLSTTSSPLTESSISSRIAESSSRYAVMGS